MKETISKINKQIFWHRLSLLWCYMRFALLFIYVLFIFFSPFAIGICVEKMGKSMSFFFGWIKWLCYPMYLYNFYALEKNSFIRDEYKKISLRANKTRDTMYNKRQLKVLFKKAKQKKLDYFELNEMCYILKDLGVEKITIEDIIKDFSCDDT